MIEEWKENEFVEFKESLSQLDKGICALSAMLNKYGEGTVYFGVDDNGNITKKIMIGKNTLNDIRNKIKDLIKPSFTYDLENLEKDGKSYIRLHAIGLDKPYSFDGRYFIRNASSNELIDPTLLRRIFTDESVDLIKQIPSDLQELTFKRLILILSSNGIHSENRTGFFKSIGLYNSRDQFNYMAFLLSDQNNISIKVTTFGGIDKTHMRERKEFGRQCLLQSVIDVLSYMSIKNSTKVDLSKGPRIETSLFDMESFREAWINACLHNNWASMVPPSVFIYDDRIEIMSYGQLPYSLSLNRFFEGESKPINKALFNIFIMSNLAEQSGHGVPIIAKKYGRKAFDFGDDLIKVTITFAFTPDDVSIRKNKETAKLTENQRMVFDYLMDNPNAKIREISQNLELGIPTIKKILIKLQQNGFLVREGSKRASIWKRAF